MTIDYQENKIHLAYTHTRKRDSPHIQPNSFANRNRHHKVCCWVWMWTLTRGTRIERAMKPHTAAFVWADYKLTKLQINSNEGGEPLASYWWTSWVWDTTSWSSRLPKNFRNSKLPNPQINKDRWPYKAYIPHKEPVPFCLCCWRVPYNA